jgi:hypothetical protein
MLAEDQDILAQYLPNSGGFVPDFGLKPDDGGAWRWRLKAAPSKLRNEFRVFVHKGLRHPRSGPDLCPDLASRSDRLAA